MPWWRVFPVKRAIFSSLAMPKRANVVVVRHFLARIRFPMSMYVELSHKAARPNLGSEAETLSLFDLRFRA